MIMHVSLLLPGNSNINLCVFNIGLDNNIVVK